VEKIKIIIIFLFSLASYAQIDDFKEIEFYRADSIANAHKGENLDNLPLLAHKLTAKLSTDVEKFRAIYTWVSTNIDNDYSNAVKNQRKRKKILNNNNALNKWNTKFKTQVFKKLLKDKKTICTGYAYLVKELASIADIECEIVDGYGRLIDTNIGAPAIPNHSWNAVNLNNKWYLCDATWSSGYTNLPDYTFIHDYNEGYFLTTPELFAKNHYPLDTKWLLTESGLTLSNFLYSPLVYGDTFRHSVIPITPNTMYLETIKNKTNIFSLKVPEPFKIDDLKVEINNGSNSLITKPTKANIKKNILNFDYQFKSAGNYDFHVKLKDKVIVTYMIRVKRK